MSCLADLGPDARKTVESYLAERIKKVAKTLEDCGLEQVQKNQGAISELRLMQKSLDNQYQQQPPRTGHYH